MKPQNILLGQGCLFKKGFYVNQPKCQLKETESDTPGEISKNRKVDLVHRPAD